MKTFFKFARSVPSEAKWKKIEAVFDFEELEHYGRIYIKFSMLVAKMK
jgi:hypothetical protein